MKIQFTKNVAINVAASMNSEVAEFYKTLGLQSQQYAPDFTVLKPTPYSCYVVSWEPKPLVNGEVCLQFETDDINEAKNRVEMAKGTILSFADDTNAPGKKSLWFRDPAGNLMNITEMQ